VQDDETTVSVCEACTPPIVARICVEPALRPVARPVPSTLATAVEDDDQVTACPVTGDPVPSKAWAVNWRVRPTSTEDAAGDTTTLVTVGTTTDVEESRVVAHGLL
jgi:hypothetical protein